MEFIALDDQPFSVVEDIGFRRLILHIEPRYILSSRRYFAETCLPAMYDRVAKHVHELMSTDIQTHTAVISDALSTIMLDTWHIEKSNVHVIVQR